MLQLVIKYLIGPSCMMLQCLQTSLYLNTPVALLGVRLVLGGFCIWFISNFWSFLCMLYFGNQ